MIHIQKINMSKFLNLSILIVFTLGISSCFWRNNKGEFRTENGIDIEVFDSINRDENRYTSDNEIYKPSRRFVFNYKYIKNGKSYFFKANDSDWDFTSVIDTSENVTKGFTLTVFQGRKPFNQMIPDYSQTVIEYELDGYRYTTKTGIIENEKNVWMHPPRDKLFRILELNPFPYIKKPFKKGNSWTWNLKVGKKWGDDRWATWDSTLLLKHHYEILGYEKLTTPLGVLKCVVVFGTSTSEIGKTRLTSYFHKKYGFVRLEYLNVDKSQINMYLQSIIEE
jgi:hypothetical protein